MPFDRAWSQHLSTRLNKCANLRVELCMECTYNHDHDNILRIVLDYSDKVILHT